MERQVQLKLERAAKNAPRSVVEAATLAIEAGRQPARAPFVARALQALARLATQLDEAALGEAAGAPSDLDALLRAMAQPEAERVLAADDPLAPARLRGLQAREWLLQAEGGILGATDVAALLHISRQAVDKRRRAGTLLAMSLGRHGYAYPAWQFVETGTLSGLAQVLAVLHDADPWMQLAFFLNGNARLEGQTPLAALREGRRAEVLHAAALYAEHGAA